MFKIWWQMVHFQRSYNLQKKIDGPTFADPSIAAVNLRRLWFVRNNYGCGFTVIFSMAQADCQSRSCWRSVVL